MNLCSVNVMRKTVWPFPPPICATTTGVTTITMLFVEISCLTMPMRMDWLEDCCTTCLRLPQITGTLVSKATYWERPLNFFPIIALANGIDWILYNVYGIWMMRQQPCLCAPTWKSAFQNVIFWSWTSKKVFCFFSIMDTFCLVCKYCQSPGGISTYACETCIFGAHLLFAIWTPFAKNTRSRNLNGRFLPFYCLFSCFFFFWYFLSSDFTFVL